MKPGVKTFTIVELLAVIVIIAVLTTLLLPVLSASRLKVRDTSCKNNLRQIGLSMQLYRSDNDERHPDYGAIGARDAMGMEYIQANYRRGLGENDGGGPEIYGVAAALSPYLGNNVNVWICPNATALKQSYKNTYAWYAKYFNVLSQNKGKSYMSTSTSPTKLDKTPILFDNITYAPIPTGTIASAVQLPPVPAIEKIGPHRQSDPYARQYPLWAGVYGVSATGYVYSWNAASIEK